MTTLTGFTAYPTRDMTEDEFDDAADDFIREMEQFVDEMNLIVGEINTNTATASAAATTATNAAATAQAAANAATNAANTQGTSTTNLTIGGGNKTLVIQTGKSIVAGQFMEICSQTDLTAYMIGQVQSYTSGTGSLTVSVVATNGSGTFAAWNVFLSTDVTKLLAFAKPLYITADTNAVAGFGPYVVGAALTLYLPATPVVGDAVSFRNGSGLLTPVIARNGNPIMGLAEDMTLDDLNAHGCLVYVDATRGWLLA